MEYQLDIGCYEEEFEEVQRLINQRFSQEPIDVRKLIDVHYIPFSVKPDDNPPSSYIIDGTLFNPSKMAILESAPAGIILEEVIPFVEQCLDKIKREGRADL